MEDILALLIPFFIFGVTALTIVSSIYLTGVQKTKRKQIDVQLKEIEVRRLEALASLADNPNVARMITDPGATDRLAGLLDPPGEDEEIRAKAEAEVEKIS